MVPSYRTRVVIDGQNGLVFEFRVAAELSLFEHPITSFGDPCWRCLGHLGFMPDNALEVWPLPEDHPDYKRIQEQNVLYQENIGVYGATPEAPHD